MSIVELPDWDLKNGAFITGLRNGEFVVSTFHHSPFTIDKSASQKRFVADTQLTTKFNLISYL